MQEQKVPIFDFETPPQPYWIATTSSTDYPALSEDIKVDTAIVGGGLVGITTAYLLKQQGLKVAIIEADRILQGTTGHTTAKLTSQHDLIYDKLTKHLGREKAQLYATANQHALKFVEEIISEKNIDCHFSHQASYIYTQDDSYLSQLETELKAATALGLPARYVESCPLPLDIKGALVFDNQAQFHPRKYGLALADAIQSSDSYIFENSRVIDLHEGSPCTIITDKGHKITADNVVIATHFPFYGSNQFYFARLDPSRAYALGIRIKESFPGGMYLSAESPSRSLRFTPIDGDQGEQLVIIGGDEHRPGEGPDTRQHYSNLLDFANQLYQVDKVLYRWSTQDYTTLDDVPYVGLLNPAIPNIYLATGFRKWGMTNSTVAGIIISDLIVKGKNPWAEVYSPARFEADPMVKNFVTTNFDVAKHLIADKIQKAAEAGEPEEGEAIVVEHNGEKIGLYKDKKGKVHKVDITCTHMGCDLMWNAAELSWDCPCHGSRFTYEGEIIEGPALKTLHTKDDFKFNP